MRRLGPSFYDSPKKKYQEFQATQKNIRNFSNPHKYPHSVPCPQEKDPKMPRNDLLILSNFVMTPKNIHKIFILQTILIFSEKPKNIEIKILSPPPPPHKKMAQVYVCMKISEPPPPPPPPPGLITPLLFIRKNRLLQKSSALRL